LETGGLFEILTRKIFRNYLISIYSYKLEKGLLFHSQYIIILNFFRYINIFIILLFTSSCGGGGGGAVPTISFDYTTGTPSDSTKANSNLLLGSNSSLPYTDVSGNYYGSLTAANNALNSGLYPIATQDTSA
jgi:hypothetical protein